MIYECFSDVFTMKGCVMIFGLLGLFVFLVLLKVILRKTCLIKHDWEILEDETDYGLMSQWTYYRRVCMKCGKVQDTINPWRNEKALIEAKKSERKRKAKSLYDLDIKETNK